MAWRGMLRTVLLLAAVCAVHALDYYAVLGVPRNADEQVRAVQCGPPAAPLSPAIHQTSAQHAENTSPSLHT